MRTTSCFIGRGGRQRQKQRQRKKETKRDRETHREIQTKREWDRIQRHTHRDIDKERMGGNIVNGKNCKRGDWKMIGSKQDHTHGNLKSGNHEYIITYIPNSKSDSFSRIK